MHPRLSISTVAATLALILGLSAPAAAVTIVASPQNTASGFKHNVFHSATGQGGAGGTILAWYDLDPGGSNDWNLGTGVLTAEFDIFDDSALTTFIGTATATGNIDGSEISDAVEQNLIIGSLTWTFDLSADTGSSLYAHLEAVYGAEGDDIWENITMQFADVMYSTSAQGRTANTYVHPDLSLWGADGTFSGSSLLGGPGGFGGFGSTALLGTDLVLELPEVQPWVQLAMGLAGLWGYGRRRRSRAPVGALDSVPAAPRAPAV